MDESFDDMPQWEFHDDPLAERKAEHQIHALIDAQTISPEGRRMVLHLVTEFSRSMFELGWYIKGWETRGIVEPGLFRQLADAIVRDLQDTIALVDVEPPT